MAFVLWSFLQAALGLPYQLRFENSAANYWAVVIGSLMIPFLLLRLSRPLAEPGPRQLGTAIAILLAVPCLLLSSCAAFLAPSAGLPDDSYELISEVQSDKTAYRLYRTNCGATCAFGLNLREERDLFGGLKLVSQKWSLYRASKGQLKLKQASVVVVDGDQVLARISL
ncbi:hypothetical protein [Variovorax sp. HJSM1_2]|uniref:hypothetical protein n=1 Tax=Variovorax sp. HJSM1_2 TaxID=3366263 RepID=UPI003BC06E85